MAAVGLPVEREKETDGVVGVRKWWGLRVAVVVGRKDKEGTQEINLRPPPPLRVCGS